MNLLELFLLFLKASALSFGGLGGVPILHQDLAARNLPELDKMFGQALAVGRISPGPNGLYLVSLGYQIDGVLGGVAAAAALGLPPFVVLAIVLGYNRVAHLPRTSSALVVLSFALAGSLGCTSWQIIAGSATNALEWAAGIAGFVVAARTRVNPLLLILGAGVIGVAVYR